MGVLGIDCGKSGAICFHDGTFFRFYDLPYKDGEVDIHELNKLTFMMPLECIVIEEQTTYTSDGRLGAFTMGLNYGRLLAWAESRCSQLCRVRPQTWQASHGIKVAHAKGTSQTDRKKATKAAALATLVNINKELAESTFGPRGGQRDGIVDAILISIWGYNELGKSFWPTRNGTGVFADVSFSKLPKGTKGLQRSRRSGGSR